MALAEVMCSAECPSSLKIDMFQLSAFLGVTNAAACNAEEGRGLERICLYSAAVHYKKWDNLIC